MVTGFRFAYGGAQSFYGVTPDVCTLGKLIGGGMPLAAIAGKGEIMAHFDKAKVGEAGFLMQLGTLSGNPLASVAGLKTLEVMRRSGTYERLMQTGNRLMQAFSNGLTKYNHQHQIVGHPTLFDVVFIDQSVNDYRDVVAADATKGQKFNQSLRKRGIFKSPGKVYPSLALTEEDLQQTEAAIEQAARDLVTI